MVSNYKTERLPCYFDMHPGMRKAKPGIRKKKGFEKIRKTKIELSYRSEYFGCWKPVHEKIMQIL